MSSTTVVVASDLTGASDKVVATAGGLASALGAELVSVHVITDARLKEVQDSMPHEGADLDGILERFRHDLDQQLTRVAAGIPSSSEVVVGEEAPNLEAFAADRGADMLVIGVRNRSRIGKLLMGSVTQEVLLASKCPVVAVPTD
jgi:nucleotide-binding universal stress UspA family protein